MRGVGYLLRRLDDAPVADAGSSVRDVEMASLAVWDHRGGGEKVASLSATAMALVSLVRADWALGGVSLHPLEQGYLRAPVQDLFCGSVA